MTDLTTDDHREQRGLSSISRLLIIVAIAIATGRIAIVTSPEGDTAFLSANDRSRWCTVAALVEHGTYTIDQQIEISHPIHRNRRPWGTIDKVRHTGANGKLHYYSSKPPLFPTMVAGVYKLMHLSTGLTMTAQPIYVPRIILAIVNLPMLAIFLLSTAWGIERICSSVWAKSTGVAATCFGTMVLPFTVSLNNHLPAVACSALVMAIYLWAADRDTDQRPIAWWVWAVAGLAASFAAANELPALSMATFWFVLFAYFFRRSIVPFAIGAAVVTVASFGTNWIAHQSLRPAYAHRGVGAMITAVDEVSVGTTLSQKAELQRILGDLGLIDAGASFTVEPSDEPNRLRIQSGGRLFALVRSGDVWQLAHWDDWYEYPGTYWRDGNRRGVDRGEPSRLRYFIQMTIGHHGIFSLSPIWLLLPFGFAISITKKFSRPGFGSAFTWMSAAVLISTLVCIAFYISRPTIDRNYGGVSVCFRWLLWFAPMWLVMISTALDRMSTCPNQRRFGLLLLAISIFSMSTALSSPWQSPWLYRFWQFLGWIGA